MTNHAPLPLLNPLPNRNQARLSLDNFLTQQVRKSQLNLSHTDQHLHKAEEEVVEEVGFVVLERAEATVLTKYREMLHVQYRSRQTMYLLLLLKSRHPNLQT